VGPDRIGISRNRTAKVLIEGDIELPMCPPAKEFLVVLAGFPLFRIATDGDPDLKFRDWGPLDSAAENVGVRFIRPWWGYSNLTWSPASVSAGAE
jgi:hypothetical protein